MTTLPADVLDGSRPPTPEELTAERTSGPEVQSSSDTHLPWPAKIQTIQEYLDEPDVPSLVGGLCGAKELGVLAGKGGVGKSFLMLDLMVAGATGKAWAGGTMTIGRPLRSLYAFGEGGSGMKRRLGAVMSCHRTDTAALANYIALTTMLPDLALPLRRGDGRSELGISRMIEDTLEVRGWDSLEFVILDTLRKAARGAEENSSTEMGEILHEAEKARQYGATVILVHHAGKGDTGSGFRGRSVIADDVDFILSIEPLKGGERGGLISSVKAKDLEPIEDLKYTLVSERDSLRVFWPSIEVQEDGEFYRVKRVVPELLATAGENLTKKQLESACNTSRGTLDRVLAELEEEGVITFKSTGGARSTRYYRMA